MNRLPTSHHRAKAIIRACVESGAGIDFIPDAPNFRYVPPAEKRPSDAKPTKPAKVSLPCGPACACKKSLWYKHTDLAPTAYEVLNLTDTSWDEADAKAAWKNGNPEPLRQWLARHPWKGKQ